MQRIAGSNPCPAVVGKALPGRPARSSPGISTLVLDATQNSIALGAGRRRVLGVTEPGVTSRRDRRNGTPGQDRFVAGTAVVRAVRGHLTDVAFDRSSTVGRCELSCTALVVRSTATMSLDVSSTHRCSFLQVRRRDFSIPCLRTYHSPAPNTLSPVVSITTCRGCRAVAAWSRGSRLA